MQLKLYPGETVESPRPEDVERGIRTLQAAEDAFAILSAGEQRYIQTSGHPGIGFILEYRDCSEEQHFHCTLETVTTDQVVEAFLSYLRGDTSYKSSLPWAPGYFGVSRNSSSGVAVPIALILGALVALGLLGFFFFT